MANLILRKKEKLSYDETCIKEHTINVSTQYKIVHECFCLDDFIVGISGIYIILHNLAVKMIFIN